VSKPHPKIGLGAANHYSDWPTSRRHFKNQDLCTQQYASCWLTLCPFFIRPFGMRDTTHIRCVDIAIVIDGEPDVADVLMSPEPATAGEPRPTEPAPPTVPALAAKADDLEALRTAVIDAAGVSFGLWVSYLFVLFYLLVAAGGVTHRDLFLESPVKLPFLNVDLPLKGFFWLGPALFLVVHAYVLLHFVMLAGKVGVFDAQLGISALLGHRYPTSWTKHERTRLAGSPLYGFRHRAIAGACPADHAVSGCHCRGHGPSRQSGR
jgi:hypothetical protein